MFALTHNEAEAFGNMVEGIISVLRHPTQVLMDSGATHNFISKCFPCTLCPTLQLLELDMVVATLSGDELLSAQWFPKVLVEVFSHSLLIDLRVLNIHDFDMIFRMDWLA